MLSWLLLLNLALAYVSRPELDPPKLDIKTNTGKKEGFLFVGPYAGSLTQPGGYIYDYNGEIVWLGWGRVAGWAGNLQVTEYKGQTVLQLTDLKFNNGWGQGHVKILSQDYNTVAEVFPGNHRLIDIHEFRIVSDHSAVLTVYEPANHDLLSVGGSTNGWLLELIFQEIDLNLGEVIFEWKALDHVNLSDSLVDRGSKGDTQFNGWDYFHINSVDKDGDDYVISSRHYSTIYKIDGKTGDIIWKLVGNQAKVKLDFNQDFNFDKQHDARIHGGQLSLFDNGVNTSDQSHGKIVDLDQDNKKATLKTDVTSPDKVTATSQGNLQVLDDGLLVNWGSAGAVTKFDLNNQVVFHATFPTNAQSYRGFQFDWQGTLSEAVAVGVSSGKVYVSWNGDTKVREWAVLSGDSKVALAKRQGFETEIDYGTKGTYVVAGYDGQGNLLGKSLQFTI